MPDTATPFSLLDAIVVRLVGEGLRQHTEVDRVLSVDAREALRDLPGADRGSEDGFRSEQPADVAVPHKRLQYLSRRQVDVQ